MPYPKWRPSIFVRPNGVGDRKSKSHFNLD
jgi:hypothetical protein